MHQYKRLLRKIYELGTDIQQERTGVGTRSLFGETLKFGNRTQFPIVTTKRVPFKLVVAELLWFLSGSRDVADLQEMGCHIWDANAEADYWAYDENQHRFFEGDLGRVYGVQWRHWRDWAHKNYTTLYKQVDQIRDVIESIRSNPFSRRHIVSAWNVGDVKYKRMALPPCHVMFQFRVNPKWNELDLLMFQRSCDMFLGVPFNISSYSLLLNMVAQVTGYRPGTFTHVLGDAHIYHNHFEQVEELLSREPRPLPRLRINPDVKEIDDFTMDDFELIGYNPHPHIPAEMAV